MSDITNIIPLGTETSDTEAFRQASRRGYWVIEKDGQKQLASHRVLGWRCTKGVPSKCLTELLEGDTA